MGTRRDASLSPLGRNVGVIMRAGVWGRGGGRATPTRRFAARQRIAAELTERAAELTHGEPVADAVGFL